MLLISTIFEAFANRDFALCHLIFFFDRFWCPIIFFYPFESKHCDFYHFEYVFQYILLSGKLDNDMTVKYLMALGGVKNASMQLSM